MEKLVVEFEIERTEKRKYGYEEKYLKYKGEAISYKAIVKDGDFIAIVGKKYKLIPNEEVEEEAKKLADKEGYTFRVENEFPKVFVYLLKDEEGVLISNSVDGSLALRVDVLTKINGKQVYLPVSIAKRKHYGEPNVSLKTLVSEAIEESKKFASTIEEMKKIRLQEFKEEANAMINKIPKKCRVDLTDMLLNKNATLCDLFSKQLIKIWSSNSSTLRKIKLARRFCNRVSSFIAMF